MAERPLAAGEWAWRVRPVGEDGVAGEWSSERAFTVNAEHPVKFTPSAGKITAFNVPGGNGVRVDTAQYAESVVPPYYDSLIAKLIVHGRDRAEAIAKMERALSQFIVQ